MRSSVLRDSGDTHRDAGLRHLRANRGLGRCRGKTWRGGEWQSFCSKSFCLAERWPFVLWDSRAGPGLSCGELVLEPRNSLWVLDCEFSFCFSPQKQCLARKDKISYSGGNADGSFNCVCSCTFVHVCVCACVTRGGQKTTLGVILRRLHLLWDKVSHWPALCTHQVGWADCPGNPREPVCRLHFPSAGNVRTGTTRPGF